MAVAFQTVSTTAFGSRTSISIDKPSGTVDGDLMIAVITAPGSGQTINSVPSGWTLLDSEANTTTYVYYKIASSEGSDYNWGFIGTATCAGGILRIDGHDDSSPTDQSSDDYVADNATPSLAVTITPSSANGMLVMVISSLANSSNPSIGSYAVASDDPSWTERFELTLSSATNQAFSVATASRPETSATGNASCTITNGTGNTDTGCILFNIQIEPDVSVTGTTGVINVIGNEGAVSAGATVTGTTGVVNMVGNEGSVSAQDSKINNIDKSNTSPTIVNKPKS